MTSIMLSKRLLQLVHCIPPDSRVADIGTDHGTIPIYLVHNQVAKHVIAGDIGERPLAGARKNIETKLGLKHGIDLRCGNGLTVLETGEVDAVIITHQPRYPPGIGQVGGIGAGLIGRGFAGGDKERPQGVGLFAENVV